MSENLVQALLQASNLAGPEDGISFVDRAEEDHFIHWTEIKQRALRTAGSLHALGVRPGEHVALILPTCPEFIDCWFGCHCLGAIPVALYPPVRLGRLDEYFKSTVAMLKSVDASCIVADPRVRRVLGRLLPEVPLDHGLLKAEKLNKGTPVAPHQALPDDTAMIQFSSGTTVAPKPVTLSHAQVLANTDAIMDFFPADSGVRHAGVSWLPLYHDMGLIGCILPALMRPGPLALIPPEIFLSRPGIWLRAISRHRATLSPAPDFAYGLCVDRVTDEELEGCDLSSWRIALDGAESVSASRARAFIQRFAPWGFRPEALTPVYGLSEAALAVTFSDPTRPMRSVLLEAGPLGLGTAKISTEDDPQHIGNTVELVSVGRPLRGFSVDIRSAELTPLPERKIGEIWVRGPSLMKGYLGGIENPIIDGWLQTGDLGFLDQGDLFISGRAKDLIVLRGRNHHPVDIEASLMGVVGLRTGCYAAVGKVDSDGERLLVFVEAREPEPDTAERCRKAILAGTGLDPDLVCVLEPGSLPRTSSGKIRRAEALRRWSNGVLCPPDRVTPWLLAGAMSRSALGFLRGPAQTDP